MKNYILIAAMLLSMAVLQPTNAQVSVNVNIGVQPLWGPVGYDYVEYYYLPAYEVYYYVPTAQFIYLDGPKWIFAAALPPRFGVIDYYSCYKVVINQPKAYLNFKTHKVKYIGYKGGGRQVVIRDSREPKYFVVKGHPNYGQAKKVSAPAPVRAKTAPAGRSFNAAPSPSFKQPGSVNPAGNRGNSGGGGRGNGGGNKGGGGHGKGGKH